MLQEGQVRLLRGKTGRSIDVVMQHRSHAEVSARRVCLHADSEQSSNHHDLQLDSEFLKEIGCCALVSSFFSLQYAFANYDKLRLCLESIAQTLPIGGFFLCIIPNGDLIWYVRLFSFEHMILKRVSNHQGKVEANAVIWRPRNRFL